MTILEGQNVTFTTTVKKSTKTSKDSKISHVTGDMIDFNLTVVKKDTLGSTLDLSGLSVTTAITQKGKWSWVEKKPSTCMICKLPIKKDQRASRCPMCHSIFHDDHIFEWLKVKGKCPVCLQGLRPGGTEVVKL